MVISLLAGCGAGDSQKPDALVEDYAIAYVKRPLPRDNNGEVVQADARTLLTFNAGGDLYVRSSASPSAVERNVTNSFTSGLGDVRDVEASYDGSKFIFAMRAPEIENADEDEQPTWNIWEYEIATQTLSRVIPTDNTAEAGQDIAPHYLPDGRILFASTRQRQSSAILLDEGKPQFAALEESRNEPAFVLHVMEADGSDIHQISFNQSHDLDPSVLSDGRVVFSRWDNMGSRNAMHLYTMNPDGTEMEILYGAHSHDTGTDDATVQFLQTRETQDGDLLSIIKPFTGTYGGGNLVLIDTNNYIDNDQPTAVNAGILSGPAQSAATGLNARSDTEISPGGRFSAAYPLWDGSGRLLISWSQCRLVENGRIVPCTAARLAAQNPQEAEPLYGIYIYDRAKNTQLPIVTPEEGVMFSEVVAAQLRATPEIIFDQVAGVELDSAYADEGVGVLHIRSVYDFDGSFNDLGSGIADLETVADTGVTTATQRPARFLRIIKAVSMADDDVVDIDGTAFGRSSQQLMREIIGYAPIEPDGSVMVKVPANVPLAISVLDENGRRISERHQNWIQVKPGETLECNGCHDHVGGIPHGRSDGPVALNDGAATSGVPFTNTDPTVIPEIGETMAETRMRISCATDCAALEPTVDVVFDDVWTDTGVRAADASFSYLYSDLTTTVPTDADCLTDWDNTCRIVVNYETHIHPLWTKVRQTLDAMDNVIADDTCTLCHSPTDAMDVAQVPAAQLDLTDGPSPDEPDHFNSYRELLFGDNEQELVGGNLQDVMVQATDGNGDPLFETDANGDLVLDGGGNPIPVLEPVTANGPSMSAASANAGYFLEKFDAGGSHAGYMDPAELRLISEWLDIGAQYYNNPFDVPQN
jgi:hypothetical protein